MKDDEIIAKLHRDAQKVVNDDALNTTSLYFLRREKLIADVDIIANNVKGKHIQFYNTIESLFSTEADRHEDVQQAVVCKRRGFDSVVRYMSTMFDCRTV